MQKRRPVYLNLLKIKLPAGGIVSILHRISGLLLFLAIPLLLLLLQRSLTQEGFGALAEGRGILARLLLGLVLWGFVHHLLAGLRFLLLDMHWGISLPRARLGARLVMFASAATALSLGVWLW